MAENSRKMLSDEETVKVAGGGLYINGTPDAPVLEWRDQSTFEIVRTYNIVGSANEVKELLMTKYWEFSEGQRDQQMLQYLGEHGYLA